jgi:hypothetical protein
MSFSWYVANFGSYNATYGSLGAVIGFMTWMWLSIIVVLLGAKLNAELEHQTAKDATHGAAKPMGTRGAEMADTAASAQKALSRSVTTSVCAGTMCSPWGSSTSSLRRFVCGT